MSQNEKLRRALELHKLELQWSIVCRKNKVVERTFSIIGIIFCLMVANLALNPPKASGVLYLSVWAALLCMLVLCMPLMLHGAWQEWQVFTKMSKLQQDADTPAPSGRQQRLRLFWEYVRQVRD